MSDFTIIGGGVIGMTIARELTLAGASVELLERGTPGQEASWAGGGILSPLHPWRYPDALLRLANRSQQLFQTLAESLHDATGIDPQWHQCGLLVVDSAEKQQALAWGQRWQMPLQSLTSTALYQCEPALNPQTEQGLYLPEIAQVRNPRLLAALRTHLRQLKVDIHSGTEVKKFISHADQVTALVTNHGERNVSTPILCAGAWGAELLATTGLNLPLQPVRGQMLIIKTPPGTLRRIILRGPRYLIPRQDGRVLVGSTIEHCGFDKQTTTEARETLLDAAIDMAPCLAQWPVEHHWAGLRPGSPTGVPYIARHPQLTNLYSALGHFRNGLMLAPATAELVKNLTSGATLAVDAADYDYPSFAEAVNKSGDSPHG